MADPSRKAIRLNIQGLIKTDDVPPAYLQITATGIKIPTSKVLGTIDGLPGARVVVNKSITLQSILILIGQYQLILIILSIIK
jgi:hypothetical protein